MTSISQKQILEGPIVKTLFVLGWPIMVSSLLETMYTLVDAFWLGKLGQTESKNAVAALQVSWPIIFLLISIAIGFGLAGVALVSQYTGAQNKTEADKSAGQVISISLIFGLVVGVLGFWVSPFIVNLMHIEHAISDLAALYMRIIFIGLPFMFTMFGFASILRAFGDTLTPMKIEGSTVLLNMVFDPIFIFGLFGIPKLGVLGAALTTISCQAIAAFIALYLLFSGKSGLRIELSYLKPVREKILKIFRIGLPASMGQSGTAFGFVIIIYVIARLPNQGVALAAYGIGDRIINLMFIAINGLGVGVSTVLGQSLGADKISRAEEAAHKGMAIMFFILVGGCLILFLLRKQVMGFFIDDEEVITEGANFLKIFLFGVPFFGIFSAVTASFAGSGHNVPTMVLELSRLWLLRVPLAYLFGIALGWNSAGIWFGMGLSNVVGALIALALFRTGIWKKKVI